MGGEQRDGRAYTKSGASGVLGFVETITTFRDQAEGTIVAELTTVTITIRPSGSAERKSSEAPSEPTTQRILQDRTKPLSITDFVRYQGAAGDFNPIHHDDAFARAAGSDGPFAVGMLAAGLAASRLDRFAPRSDIRQLEFRWQRKAWPGEALDIEVFRSADGGPSLDIVVSSGEQGRYLTGRARVCSLEPQADGKG